jgi:hypothetical protein
MNAAAVKPLLVPAGIVGGLALVTYLVLRALRSAAAPTVGETATSGGGIAQNALNGLFGLGQSSSTVSEIELDAGSLHVPTPDPGSLDPLDFISGGIVDPRNGGTVRRVGYGSQTVRLTAELSNSGTRDWTGALMLDVEEDYLFSDEKGSFSKVVTVRANSTKQIEIDYALAADFEFREPNLFIDVFAGTKYLGPHEVVVS